MPPLALASPTASVPSSARVEPPIGPIGEFSAEEVSDEEPSDNWYTCEFCLQPDPRLPYPNCWFCPSVPSMHHGRCCLGRPRGDASDDADVAQASPPASPRAAILAQASPSALPEEQGAGLQEDELQNPLRGFNLNALGAYIHRERAL